MKKRGQTSTEVIVLLSLILIILLFILAFREDVLSTVTKSYHGTRAKTLIDSVTQSADTVYHQGSGAKIVIYVTVPKEITSISLNGNQMNVSVNISGTEQKYYRKTSFFLNGSIPEESGNYCLLIQSNKGYVEVSNFNGSC